MKLFFDFDGTLVDVSKRHYIVYTTVINELHGAPLPQPEYWDLKRKKTKWPSILELSGVDQTREPDFIRHFISLIEEPSFLAIDMLFPNAISVLTQLANDNELYLVSLRRNETNLLQEVNRLGIDHFFKKILSGHSETDGFDKKIELIQAVHGDGLAAIIGDTEADVMTGRQLGFTTIGLTTGIRDTEFLATMNPDYIIDTISDVPGIINQLI